MNERDDKAGERVLLDTTIEQPAAAAIIDHHDAALPYIGSPDPAAKPLEIRNDREHVQPIVAPMPTVTPLEMLAGALERGVEPDKLERMFDLAERYEQREAKKAHLAALAAFQAEVPQIVKNKVAEVRTKSGASFDYSYSDLDNIMSVIRPILGKHGLSVTFDCEFGERYIKSLCHVAHAGGHVEVRTFECPIDFDASMNDSQKMGSANSYANRYNTVNALGLTTGEDDDGAQGDRSRGAPQASTSIDSAVPFGRYKGKPWDQVPLDYLEWLTSNANEAAISMKAAEQIQMRQDSDDQRAQDLAGDEGDLSMAECARGITNATTVAELKSFRDLIPERHWAGVSSFYETRQKELIRSAVDD